MGKLTCVSLMVGACAAHSPAPAPRMATPTAPAAVTATPNATTIEKRPAIRGGQGDIPLFTLDGKKVKLADYGAKVTVVALWAVWCKPCLEELPYVDALYQAYRGDQDVSVLAVHVDMPTSAREKPEKVAEVVHRLGLSLPVLRDPDFTIMKLMPSGRAPLPMLIFVDPGGKVMRKFGFPMFMPKDKWLANERATVELARAGSLPPERQPAVPSQKGKVTMRLPRKLSEGEVKGMLPRMREMLKQRYPKASDQQIAAMLIELESQAKTGETIELSPPEN